MDTEKLPATKGLSQESPFSTLHREIDRVFSDFSRGFPMLSHRLTGALSPSMDVKDAGDALEVTVELPGLSEKDFDVSIEEKTLSITGEKKTEKKRDQDDYRVMERSYGKFARSITLPFEPDADKVKASYEQGVLTLSLPKPPEEAKKVKKIAVKSKP